MRRSTEEIWNDLNTTAEFLRNLLSTGDVPLDEILLAASKRGIPRPDLNKARRSLHITTIKKEGISYWGLTR